MTDLLGLPTSAINTWLYQGKLKVAAKTGKTCAGKPFNLFRLGEVMELQQRKHKVRLERTKVWLYRPLITSDDRVCLEARRQLWAENNRKWSWKGVDRRKAAG